MAVAESKNSLDAVPRLFGMPKAGKGGDDVGGQASLDAYILVGLCWVALFVLVWSTRAR